MTNKNTDTGFTASVQTLNHAPSVDLTEHEKKFRLGVEWSFDDRQIVVHDFGTHTLYCCIQMASSPTPPLWEVQPNSQYGYYSRLRFRTLDEAILAIRDLGLKLPTKEEE